MWGWLTVMRHRLGLLGPLALTLMLLNADAARAELFTRHELFGVGPPSSLGNGGYRWEIGNNLHCVSHLTGCGDGVRLAVGDVFELTIDLNSYLVISDSTDFAEVFRTFMLGFPDSAFQDLSSIQFNAVTTLRDQFGEPTAVLHGGGIAPVQPFGTNGGDASRYGLENISADYLSVGQQMALSGWTFELTVTGDPLGLLSSTLWQHHSFAIDAESITS